MMNYKNILITGGAGFVGSNLAVKLKTKYPKTAVISLDNLHRRGSELNVPRLKHAGVEFRLGDVRHGKDFEKMTETDLIIDCAAEPSVLAGLNSSPEYVLNTNLVGTVNCLELARKNKADFIFLSTSRIYPIDDINKLSFKETPNRFILNKRQKTPGASERGIAENFPLGKTRSLYGATKLASEFLLQEYIKNYDIKGVINRFGVITGPWQMGKVDQGVVVLWLARHIFKKPLSYIGYGGTGKQARDFLHIDDAFELIDIQIQNLNKFNGEIYNVGGGVKNSFSLCELTEECQKITGNQIPIESVTKERPDDVRIYLSDCGKIKAVTNWKPKKNLHATLSEIAEWINKNKNQLSSILN